MREPPDSSKIDEAVALCWGEVLKAERGRERFDYSPPQVSHLLHVATQVVGNDRSAGVLGEMVARGLVCFLPRDTRAHPVPSALDLTSEEIRRGWPPWRLGLAQFPQAKTWTDASMRRYFELAVETASAGVPEAATFFLGGAAERLVDVFADKMTTLDATKWKRCRWVNEKIDLLAATLVEVAEAASQPRPELSTAADMLRLIGHTFRLARNEIGHPADNPPRVSWRTAVARICEFPDYVELLLGLEDV